MKTNPFRFSVLFRNLVLTILITSIYNSSPAQNRVVGGLFEHKEVKQDDYKPLINPKTSPAYKMRSSSVTITQVNVDPNGDNIMGDAANEPSIAVDPNDNDYMVIGWRQFDNVSSNFRQAGVAYTDDGGETWNNLPPLEAGVFRSDPVIGVNADGSFFYNSLTLTGSGDFFCTVFRSHDGGDTWDDGVYAQGGDKQWMVIDRSDGIGQNNIYASWNSSYSGCYPNFFTRSIDLGNSYQDCLAVPGNPHWGTLAVGPDGELYVVGTDGSGLVISRSDNAQDPDGFLMWDMFSGNLDLDGTVSGFTEINPEGLLGQIWVDVDRSDGPGRGNVYVVASVYRDMSGDPGDVMFAKSTDGGVNWDDPIKINDDVSTDNTQWFGTMSVAPDGRIDVIWLDTRDAIGYPYLSALYYSYSVDEGQTWSENEKISELFNPHVGYPNQNKMGDYFDMESSLDGVDIAWASTLNNEEDVYYAHINPWYVGKDENTLSSNNFTNYPNPVTNSTVFRYKLENEGQVSIEIFDAMGRKISEAINETQFAGFHNITYDCTSLKTGVYNCVLKSDGKIRSLKLIRL